MDELIRYFGSMKKTAEFFGVSVQAVWNWKNRSGQLPDRHKVEAIKRGVPIELVLGTKEKSV